MISITREDAVQEDTKYIVQKVFDPNKVISFGSCRGMLRKWFAFDHYGQSTSMSRGDYERLPMYASFTSS